MDEKWFPGHMMKAYRRLKENVKIVDVLIEIRDARAPVASTNSVIDKLNINKKRILVLNKDDLAETKATEEWVKYFSSKDINVFPMSSIRKKGIGPILGCLKQFFEEKKEKLLLKGRRDTKLKVMVLGIPNVGKSSFINSLSKTGKVKVGKKPGLTRGEQWLKISDGIELLDTPGVLPFSKKENDYWKLAIIGSIDRDKLEPIAVIERFYNTFPSHTLWRGMKLYDFLLKIGEEYNFFISGGRVDTDKTAKGFLQDLETGKFLKFLTLEFPQSFIGL